MKPNIPTPPPIPAATTDEFDIMRSEMQALQSHLSLQPLIDENRLRQLICSPSLTPTRGQNRSILWLNWALVPIMAAVMLSLRYIDGISWLFIIATILLYIASTIVQTRTSRQELSRDDYSTLPIVDLRRKILKRISHRNVQICWGLPIWALWAVWFLYELFSSPTGSFAGPSWRDSLVVYIVIFASAMIGVLIYYLLYQRIDRKAIREIDSFVHPK